MFRPLPGWNFLAVAEDISLTDDAGGSPSVIRVSEPLRAVAGTVPLMDVGKSSSVVGRRPAGLSDSDVRRNSEEGSSPVDIVTVPELIEHSAVGGGVADPPFAGQPMENTGESGDLQNGRQSHADNRNVPLDVGTGGQESPQDIGETIVVGSVGLAAPWFMTGWADGVEVEFMIDTGCQVTILATSVFERMCASDPRVRSRLRQCGRRLVSADFSPLTVRGELEMTVVFPGLSCDMILVVASIGSDGLLGTEALQSCLPHQLDLRTGHLWVEGRSTLQLHQQRLAPRAAAYLTTLVVMPLDSEVVAPVSVRSPSGIRPGP